MTRFRIDSNASTVVVRTKAEGLLSRFAHDLEIAAARVTGEATEDDGAVRGSIEVPVNGLQVVGALEGGRVNRATLTAKDLGDIEHKIRDEAFAGLAKLAITLEGSRAKATLRVRGPHKTQETSAVLRVEERDGATHVTSAFELSLAALGVPPIKAPLGAFKLADHVSVHVALALRPEA